MGLRVSDEQTEHGSATLVALRRTPYLPEAMMSKPQDKMFANLRQQLHIVAQAEDVQTAQAYDRERADLPEVTTDGEYLLPVVLFETNKDLFDIGMRNLFGAFAAETKRKMR